MFYQKLVRTNLLNFSFLNLDYTRSCNSTDSSSSLETSEHISRRKSAEDFNDSVISSRSSSSRSQIHDDLTDCGSFPNQNKLKFTKEESESPKERISNLDGLKNNQDKSHFDIESYVKSKDFSKNLVVDYENDLNAQNTPYFHQQHHQILLLNKFYNDLRTKSGNEFIGNISTAPTQNTTIDFKSLTTDLNKAEMTNFSSEFFQNAVANFALMNKNNLANTFNNLSSEFISASAIKSSDFK
jgi:hypothetical protein